MLGGRCQVFLGIRGFDPKPAISGFRSLLSRPPILKPVRRPKLNQTRANRDSKAAMGCSIDRTAVYPDMGMQHLKTSTKSESAQVWFDRGLIWLFGFNHFEAVRCFQKALEKDPKLAIAHWGIGFAMGHNYNFPWIHDRSTAYSSAATAAEVAKEVKMDMASIEGMLIEALTHRYEKDMIDETKDMEGAVAQIARLQNGFVKAMKKVHDKFGSNPHVSAIYGEALMNLKPWELWIPDPKTGKVPEYTLEAQKVLEAALDKHPDHPGLCHLYVHLMELSSTPEKALKAADQLASVLVPGSGHLVHMASHIDMWVGDYKRAIEVNTKAYEADQRYVEQTGDKGGMYAVYRGHNVHFLIWAACFDGQSQIAIKYARILSALFDKETVNSIREGLDGYTMFTPMVLIRFGKWEEILKEKIPQNADDWPSRTVMIRYARGIAYAATGKVDKAIEEQKLFLEALENKNLDGIMCINNPVYDRKGSRGMFNIGKEILQGEILYRKGEYKRAFEHLRTAVKLDDELKYDEPWGWMMPTRHTLGALLSEQKHYEEAEKAFQEDLKKYPENIWSLVGLKNCMEGQGKAKAAAEVSQRLKAASARADIPIAAACLCANGKRAESKNCKGCRTE
ncbi:hypothetical protein AAMO2058_000276600 [Amorphochlora amoebiformis]